MKCSFKTYYLLLLLLTATIMVDAQNNVGVGTTTPHPAALLQASDTGRGMLIPQTDTAAVRAYVNSLTPPSNIADGLMIYDVNMKTYVYYDGGKKRWIKLIDLIGPTGPRGPRGPRGATGLTGHSTDWRDSTNATPVLLPRDSCGDWYFNNSSGEVWFLHCDTDGTNKHWIDTISADNHFGIMKAPDETVTIEHLVATGNGNQPPAAGGSLNADVNWIDITGLAYAFSVGIDEIAYVWVAAHGSVSHSFGKNNYSYAQYDIQLDGASGAIVEGHAGKFYFDRDAMSNGNMGNIYAIAKNGPPEPLQAFGLFDQVAWHVSAGYVLEGPFTLPEPCEDLCDVPMSGCPPCPTVANNFSVKVVAGNRVSPGNVDVKLWSGLNTNNQAFMHIFILKRRHPNAIPRKR